MASFFNRPWGWVTAAPLLCALHCAATPLLVLAVPAFSPWKTLEAGLLVVTAVLAATALTVGHRRHGRPGAAVVVVGGLILWALSLAHALAPVPEEVTTVTAALLVAAGLVWNSRRLCAAPDPPCACPACDQESEARPAPAAGGAPVRRHP